QSSRSSAPHDSATGRFDRQRRRWGRWLGQQGREPDLIEQHLLVRRLPEGTDLLFLASGRKGLLLYGQGNDVLEMVSFGITAAGLPLPHRASGDPQQVGQARLRQANGGAQGQHGLSKAIVSLTIGEPLHR